MPITFTPTKQSEGPKDPFLNKLPEVQKVSDEQTQTLLGTQLELSKQIAKTSKKGLDVSSEKIIEIFTGVKDVITSPFQKINEVFGDVKKKFKKIGTGVKEKFSFDRTKEREAKKPMQTVIDLLRQGLKQKRTGMSLKALMKPVLILFGGILFSAILRLQLLVKSIKAIGSIPQLLFKGFKKVFAVSKLKNLGFIKGITGLFKEGGKLAKVGKFFTKIFGAIKMVGGFFTKTISFLMKPINFILKFLKFAPVFSKAIPVVGWLITIVMGIVDGIKGFFNAGKLLGKAEGESVSLGEKIVAMIGSIISGLFGGLLGDASEWAQGIMLIFTNPIEALKKAGKWLADTLWTVMTWPSKMIAKGVDWLLGLFGVESDTFGFISGIFDGIKNLFSKAVDWVVGIFTGENDFVSRIVDGVVGMWNTTIDWIVGIFKGENNFVNKIVTGVKDMWTKTIDFIVNLFSGKGEFVKKMKDFQMKIGRMFLDLITGVWKWVKEKAKALGGVFGKLFKKIFGKDEPVEPKFIETPKAALQKTIEVQSKVIEKAQEKGEIKEPIKTVAKIAEKEKEIITEVVMDRTATEAERMVKFMNWLEGNFATTVAKKIAAEQDPKRDVSNIKGATVRLN